MKKILKNKNIFCVIAVLLAIICLTGCAGQTDVNTDTNSGSFEITPEATVLSTESAPLGMEYVLTANDNFTYYRDVTTDVMYVMYHRNNQGGLSVMLDPETGLPLTYDNWLNHQYATPDN